MMDWLRRKDWIQGEGNGFSQTTSFIAFLVMPGCVFGAIIQWLFLRD